VPLDPEPPLGDRGDLAPVAPDRVLVLGEVALGMEARAVPGLDDTRSPRSFSITSPPLMEIMRWRIW